MNVKLPEDPKERDQKIHELEDEGRNAVYISTNDNRDARVEPRPQQLPEGSPGFHPGTGKPILHD